MQKRNLLIFLIMFILGCSKKDQAPIFSIEGKEYAARWKVDSFKRQNYVHIAFSTNGTATLWTSVEKILKYGDEKLTWIRSLDSYMITGTMKENYYKPVGAMIEWNITPTKQPSYAGSTIKSTFDADGLHFIAQ